jgi:hypoxanthine phosphoribosyltransferase
MPLVTLITEEQIKTRVSEMAAEIRADFGDEPLLLVAILKGSFVFVADLARELGENVAVDFIQVSSYGKSMTSDGNVQIRKDLDINIEDANVLIVEDIVDSGATLRHLLDMLATRRPRTLKVASLLEKPAAHRVPVNIDYVGFEIPDEFVVGYGLDLAEKYRNLACIASLRQD